MQQQRHHFIEQPRTSSNTTPYYIELNNINNNQYLQENSWQRNRNFSTLDEHNRYSTNLDIPQCSIASTQEIANKTKLNKNTKKSITTQESARRCRNLEPSISNRSSGCCNCCCSSHQHSSDNKNCSKCNKCHECKDCHHCKYCCKCRVSSDSDSDSDCDYICCILDVFRCCYSSIRSICKCDCDCDCDCDD